MKKLDSFLLKSFFGPFIMTFFIVMFVLMLQLLWLYIDELVGKGLGLSVILEFMGWGCATTLPLTLPLATLLASIMTMGNLGENYELTAMKAAGISLQRVMLPIFFVAITISIGAFFISNNLVPTAYEKITTLRNDIVRTKKEIKIPTKIFYDGIDGYILRIDDRNKISDMMYGVTVYDHTAKKGNNHIIMADSASMKLTGDKSAIVFTLYSGSSYEENNIMRYRDTTLSLQRVDFGIQEMIISLENYSFTKSEDNEWAQNLPTSMDLKELRYEGDTTRQSYQNIYERNLSRMTYNSNLVYSSQLDTAKNLRYTTVMSPDSLFNWQNPDDELRGVNMAINSISSPISSLELYVYEDGKVLERLRRISIEIFNKFALSLACLVFFFIGAPLGAIIRKGGLGTPVIVSILFFLIYWVIDMSGKKLARDGVISPFIGTFISTMVLLPIGIFLTWKSTKDSAIFNVDTYLETIKKFFKKVHIFFTSKNNSATA